MPEEYQDHAKIKLGVFEGDAPAATLSQWQMVLSGPIEVYHDPTSGMKTYLYDSIPEGTMIADFLSSIVASGIETAKLGTLSAGNRLIFGWEEFEDIGDFEGEISPAIS